MLVNSLLFIIMLLFSVFLFFINNLYIVLGLFLILLLLSFLFKVRLPVYLPFLILLFINFLFNFLLSSIFDAILVTLRLVVMFMVVNLVIKKIGITSIGKIMGNIFHSRELELIISISLSFIPIMIKEIQSIKNSLKTKNFALNLKNIILKPHLFVITFFNNLLRRVNEMEKVFISRGFDE